MNPRYRQIVRLHVIFCLVFLVSLISLNVAFYPTQVHAAANLVQSAYDTKTVLDLTNQVTATFPNPATAGNLIIAVIGSGANLGINAPIGFSTAINQGGIVASQGIFYKVATGGETSITGSVTLNSISIALHIYEYSGGYTVLSQTSSAGGLGFFTDSGTINTTVTDELLFAAFTDDVAATHLNASWNDSGEGFTERNDFNVSGLGIEGTFGAGDNLVNSIGSHNVTTQMSFLGAWRGQAVSFQQAEEPQEQVACTSTILDTLTGTTPRGTDQNFHDEDDTVVGDDLGNAALHDGFDETLPSPDFDFTDNAFSHTARTTGGLFGVGLEASSTNIIVDDPDSGSGSETDGSGYVDLFEFDEPSNSYAGVFNAQISCDTANGYDLHIADTFNMDPNTFKVGYNSRDIAILGQTPKTNLNRREGLFRIAPDSDRDIDELDLTFGSETSYIKHEYIMDLPYYRFDQQQQSPVCAAFFSFSIEDNYDFDCPPAGLDPFSSEGLVEWPYGTFSLIPDTNFGVVGFTLLCDEDGDQGTAMAGSGRINPWTRGLMNPFSLPYPNLFKVDLSGADDCDDNFLDKPVEKYAAIPSLIDSGDYDGIAGTDPTTYSAILSAENWVGYSGPILGNPPFTADNFFEIRAQVPTDQAVGNYAGTIILSCLPNMTINNEPDFDGDGIGDETPPEINFDSASDSGLEDVTPVYVPITLSEAQNVSVTVDFSFTGGSAIGGTDYTTAYLGGGTVTFPPFITTAYVPTDSLTIVDDPDPESDETIIMELTNPYPASVIIGSTNVYTYTILDNDGGGGATNCLGPGFNWASGFNFSQNCTIPSSGGVHNLTFTTDFFCTIDNTAITLVGADSSILYTDSCGGGGTLNDSTTYTVGPFTDTIASPPDATLTFTDGFGDGGFSNVSWTYTP